MKKKAGMKRREFIRAAGLAGAASASLAAQGNQAHAAQSQAGQQGQQGQRGGGQDPSEPLQPINPAVPETWNEPWVWRPAEWPGQQLDLNVVENENPGPAVTLGNPNAILFSYGGNTPGPTIRMKDDETLFVKLRNLLGQDFASGFVGPYPDPAPGALPPGLTPGEIDKAAKALGNERRDFCLGEHTNGVHSIRVTNLHTHGLHVRPSRNPNGTHSDNVILRIMSQADFRRREAQAREAPCNFLKNPQELYFLRDDEQAGQADYEFRLGNVQAELRRRENEKRTQQGKPPLPAQPHPAGTFWYHPHAHGATHNQVASGMAGFLIVEGDTDEAVNVALTGRKNPDPEIKSGDYDYRERLMFMQRVLFSNRSRDRDAQTQSLRVGATPMTNGDANPATLKMRPGAVERYRVINGSVDGRGYKRLMVVKGQYVVRGRKTFQVQIKAEERTDPNTGQTNTVLVRTIDPDKPITLADLEALEAKKQDIHQVSVDGINLITPDSSYAGGYKYTIKDLSQENAGTRNPLWDLDSDCPQWLRDNKPHGDTLCRLRNVWKNGNHVKDCFVRPNEFYMAPANRTDILFQAPRKKPSDVCFVDADGNEQCIDFYTVLAKAVVVHSDTPQQGNQIGVRPNGRKAAPLPEDVVLGHILVSGDEVEGQGNPILEKVLTRLEKVEVQKYLLPIDDDELKIPQREAQARGVGAGESRTRIVTYSGWGNADFPLVSTYPDDPSSQAFKEFIDKDQADGGKLENLVYAQNGRDSQNNPYYVLLPANIRTMAIKFNNASIEKERAAAQHPDDFPFRHPELPRKFNPSDPYRARMLENTAEEWALYNISDLLWGNTTQDKKSSSDPVDQNDDPRKEDFKQPPTQYQQHFVSLAVTRREGQAIFDENPDFQVVTKGIDHPFHVHQNPFWVTRIEIPDQDGHLTNILDEPRWMDTIWIPRRRGRVVFRTRFPDYVGAYVHHCHILLHEDNGMMHVIEATPFEDQSNYHAQKNVASASMTPQQVTDNVYPRPDSDRSYRDSMRFFDSDQGTGQLYPGFEVTPPPLDD